MQARVIAIAAVALLVMAGCGADSAVADAADSLPQADSPPPDDTLASSDPGSGPDAAPADVVADTQGDAPGGAPGDARHDTADAAPDDSAVVEDTDVSSEVSGDASPEDSAAETTPDSDGADLDTQDVPAEPPFPDLAIGPYQGVLAITVDSLRAQAGALDASASYGHVAAQGYLLQAIGELLHASRGYALEARDELVSLALGEIDELRAVSDRVLGGGPAFGLEEAWDAFQDGSTNPAFTAYTWQSGMAALGAASVARYLVHSGHPDATRVRDFGAELVRYWFDFYSALTDGGFYWYSDRPSDAIAVHNTSALIAIAGSLLAEAGGGADLGQRSEDCAALLWARMSGNPTLGYRWNYADDGIAEASRRPEDSSHALVTLQLMRHARDAGWWSNSQMRGVAVTLLDTIWQGNPARLAGFVDGSSGGEREWRWTRGAMIGYAAHGDSPGGDPAVFDYARSIVMSSYLTPFQRPLEGATVGASQALALAMLLARRPAPYESGSRWRRVAGDGDDLPPESPGGVRFYPVDWAAPADLDTGGLTLAARQATAVNANLVVDLDEGSDHRVVVSLTYASAESGHVEQWDGDAYRRLAPLPATHDEGGSVRWMRTTFQLDADRFDYQQGVVGRNVLLQLTSQPAVHLIEATPL